MFIRNTGILLISAVMSVAASAATSEIKVDLRLDASDFVVGERVRGVVDIANSSPDKVSVGYSNSKDIFFIEVSKSSDGYNLDRIDKKPFTARFMVTSGQGQKLETFLADHYALIQPNRYLAKPVLVHDGMRYEGQPRAFDIVEGVKVASAMQMFANRRGLNRDFQLVFWSRNHGEHLFLRAKDSGSGFRRWETRDLGAILRSVDRQPSISILPTGEVIVLHRLNADQFIRTEFWSLPDELEFRKREAVTDPEVAGTQRVRGLYHEKGVKPKENPWWKFW